MKLRTTKRDVKEKILTIAIFTGIFLPVRLVFYTYVTPYWLGSFGLITGIMVSMIILARKGKLGKVGNIINKQVNSFSRGKVGAFVLFETIFFIYLFSLAIYGIENAPEEMKDEVVEVLAAQGVEKLDDLANAADVGYSGGLGVYGVLFGLFILMVPTKIGFVMYSVINDMTDNWLLHFITVYLIESLEIMGLIIYFRYFSKTKVKN